MDDPVEEEVLGGVASSINKDNEKVKQAEMDDPVEEVASSINKDNEKVKQPTFNFTRGHDVALLTQCVASNVWDIPRGHTENVWLEVTTALAGKNIGGYPFPSPFKVTTAKARIKLIQEYSKQQNLKAMKATGTNEEFGEFEQLCDSMEGLLDAKKEKDKDKDDKKKTIDILQKRQGEEVREAAMGILSAARIDQLEDKKRRRVEENKAKEEGGRSVGW